MSISSQTLVDLLKIILEWLGGNKEETHPFWARFIAAFSGSSILHLALLAINLISGNNNMNEVSRDFNLSIIFGALCIILIVYSSIFALLIAVGISWGSLVRHFLFGVMLPAFVYMVAIFLLNFTKIISMIALESLERPSSG